MIPKRVVVAVLERDSVCVIGSRFCTGEPSVADHRVNRGAGGNKALNVAQNLVAACGICNGVKESDSVTAADCVARGIKIRRSQSTQIDLERCLSVPVIFPDGTSWFLTPWGKQRHEELAY
jgi:hypothetical protein